MIGIVALNLGGPDGPDAVKPFLEKLFSDPDVIQLGWLRFLQPWLARRIARRRAPESQKAYAQIGGASPILAETTAQAEAVVAALAARGIRARPYVSMAAWHPFAPEAVAAMRADGVTRAVGLPLFPHYSHTTTGSSYKQLVRALDGSGIPLARVERYPDAPGYLDALCARINEAIAELPEDARAHAPILFSAHGLPESYIKKGDPYLDDIQITFQAVQRRLGLGARARLCFQSRVGRQKWLSPYTEHTIDLLAARGEQALVVVPLSFTGEHIETLQELDIVYKNRALNHGVRYFARARTVGLHPDFIAALAEKAANLIEAQGWQ